MCPKELLKESQQGVCAQKSSPGKSQEGVLKRAFQRGGEYSLDGPPAPHASLGGQTLSPPVLPTTGRPALTVLPNHGTSGTTTTAGAGALHPVSTLHSLRCSLCTRFHLTSNHNQHSVSIHKQHISLDRPDSYIMYNVYLISYTVYIIHHTIHIKYYAPCTT